VVDVGLHVGVDEVVEVDWQSRKRAYRRGCPRELNMASLSKRQPLPGPRRAKQLRAF
jgi:hypothetical protein